MKEVYALKWSATGSIDISEDIEDTYDEYPLYDDDGLWSKLEKI